MPLLMFDPQGSTSLVLIRKGGRLMRKNGKLAIATNRNTAQALCDCCECECAGACCCHDLPNILYCRLTKWVWKADCTGNEIQTFDFTMAKDTACTTQFEDDCPGYAWEIGCVNSRWCGYFYQPGCYLGTATQWHTLLAMDCVRISNGSQGFGLWYRQEVDLSGDWGGCGYQPFVLEAACPVTVLANPDMGALGLLSVTISTAPIE